MPGDAHRRAVRNFQAKLRAMKQAKLRAMKESIAEVSCGGSSEGGVGSERGDGIENGEGGAIGEGGASGASEGGGEGQVDRDPFLRS